MPPNLWFLLLQLLSMEGIHFTCHRNYYYRFDKITALLQSPIHSPKGPQYCYSLQINKVRCEYYLQSILKETGTPRQHLKSRNVYSNLTLKCQVMPSMIKCSLAQWSYLYMFAMYFPIQCFWYLIHFWLPLWQVTVLAGVRWQRKGKIQGYRSSPISEEGSEPWIWSGWESWGRTERGVFRENEGGQSSCWVTQETHPGEIMRRKHTDMKGRASLYNREWSKIEKTFPRTKDCLPSPPPPSSRTPSLLPGTYGISLHLLSLHSSDPPVYLLVPTSVVSSRV